MTSLLWASLWWVRLPPGRAAALPLVFEAVPDGGDFGGREGGIGAWRRSVRLRRLASSRRSAVTDEVGDAELGQPGLTCAEELSGAALLEVQLREFEAVPAWRPWR